MLKHCIDKLFLEHPRMQGETYFQHMKVATKIGLKFGVASTFVLIHAVVPGVDLFDMYLDTTSTNYIQGILDTINRSSKKEKSH